MKCHSLPPKNQLSAPHQTLSQCWISGPFDVTNICSLRCSLVILHPSLLWRSSLLPIVNSIFYGSFHMYTVTMHCNRSGYLPYTKQDLNRTCWWSSSFQDFQLLTSGYSLCKNRLTCFKNEVSDISCFMYWAADQKFLFTNAFVTKTSSAFVIFMY